MTPPHAAAAAAAEPLLASQLLDDAVLDHLLDACLRGAGDASALPDNGTGAVRTGAESVDDALGGGVEGGNVVGVCCGEGSRGGEAVSVQMGFFFFFSIFSSLFIHVGMLSLPRQVLLVS